MQAVVKTPRIEINIRGEIPLKLLTVLEEEFGEQVRLLDEDKEETVDIFDTDWYQKTKSDITPGQNIRIYRQNHGLTQAELGRRLGEVPRQHISNMERGIRPISKKMARKLSSIFLVSVDKFI